MKTSNKILIVLGIVIIVVLIILIAVFRGISGEVMNDTSERINITGNENSIVRFYDLKDFNRVDIIGDTGKLRLSEAVVCYRIDSTVPYKQFSCI